MLKNFVPNQMQLSPKLKVLFFDENEYNFIKTKFISRLQ
ncbi:hypothetical protein LEP1GSC074_3812 [Leptospira noguchii str. Hook]|nr:hypothetical protein LEP1GSC074_3812 [Leptospira noguchii str. Hook]